VTHSLVCGDCEKDLTPETALALDYSVLPTVSVKIHLHQECAPEWCRQFSVPLPPAAPFSAVMGADKLKTLSA
jgi:hypothetical protein